MSSLVIYIYLLDNKFSEKFKELDKRHILF